MRRGRDLTAGLFRRGVVLVCSGGGHLEQMRMLEPFYGRYRHVFLLPEGTVDGQICSNDRVHRVPDVNEGRGIRNPGRLLEGLVRSFRILARLRPALVISTGAGIAVPAFVAARLLGIHTVYIESFARIRRPSTSGRVCYPLSDLFMVQHIALLRWYRRARYCGPLYPQL